MRPYETLGYVVTVRGDVDVNFYINKARQLRNQAIKTHMKALFEKIKQAIGLLNGLFVNPKPA